VQRNVAETDTFGIPGRSEGSGFSGPSHNATDVGREGVTSVERHKQVERTSMEK
jgi:hypothetical protein